MHSPHRSSTGSSPHQARDFAETPLVVTWELTQACELACDHCRARAMPEPDPNELTVEQATDLFEQVATFDPQPFFVFSGGDPLMRPDFFTLLERARDAGLHPAVTPATTPRLTREVIDALSAAGVRRMALSLDGATAPAHDGFRGEPGTFETALRAAEYANNIGLSIQINTTVTAETVDQLPGIAELATALDISMWEIFFLVPVGRGDELEQLEPTAAKEIAEWLYEYSQSAPFRVITVEAPFYRRVAAEIQNEAGQPMRPVGSTGAGNGFIFISHTGEVYPSGFMPVSVGNITEEPLPTIYRQSPLLSKLRDPDELNGPCGTCSYAQLCGGSRSRAYAATTDPFASDPLCPWVES